MKKTNGTYWVYIHRNKINDKRYVGITGKESPELRWGRAGNGYYSNKHFYAAIKKYGWDNFEHTIVAKDLTAEEAAMLERELIAKYQSNDPQFGYNICDGGETNLLPRSSLDKIPKANKGRVMSDEVKRRRAENPNPPKAVRVVCDGIEFRSVADCAKYYGVNPSTMRQWLSGTHYVPDRFVLMGLSIVGKRPIYQECYTKRLWVYCDDKEYPSVSEFCRQEKIPLNTVNGWLYGTYKMRDEYVVRGLRRDFKKTYKILFNEGE